MDVTVTVAIVGAIGGLLVACVSLVTALLSQRAKVKAEHELAALKQARNQKKDSLEALQNGIRAIQHAKDALLVVLEAVPKSLDHPHAADLLTEASSRISKCYEEHLPHLSPEDGEALHHAKNTMIGVELRFRSESECPKDAPLERHVVRALQRARRLLNERQMLLRDSLVRKGS